MFHRPRPRPRQGGPDRCKTFSLGSSASVRTSVCWFPSTRNVSLSWWHTKPQLSAPVYDLAFCRQAALTGLTHWSAINPTIYTLCFAGSARTATRCELCFATTHSTKECAQQGDPDPGVREWLRAIEKVLLSLAPKGKRPPPPPPIRGSGQQRSSGEICQLFNDNHCTYPWCRHARVQQLWRSPHGPCMPEPSIADRKVPLGQQAHSRWSQPAVLSGETYIAEHWELFRD